MNNPTCLIAYYPDMPNVEKNKLKVTCFDKKIHIRLRNYNRPMHIVGFEQKLSYLLSYLFHFQYIQNCNVENDNINFMSEFSKISDVNEIISTIQQYIVEHDILGISIKKNKDLNTPFGNIIPYYFPLNFNDDSYDKNHKYILTDFLERFHVSIYDYLFNDKYIVILTNKLKTDFNKKFINKQTKHKQKTDNLELNVVSLW